MNKTGQTEYIRAVAEEIGIFGIFERTPKAITTLRTMAFEVVDLEADITYLLYAKRSAMCVEK